MSDSTSLLTTFSEQQRIQAFERFSLLQPFLEQKVPLATIAREHGIPPRTIQHWVTQYRRHGLAGLARRTRSDKGQHRHFPADLQRLIEGLALQKPKRSAASIHRQVTEVAKEQHWPQPSYSQVYQIIRRLDSAVVTLAHEGTKAYREEFDLVYRREASHSNAMWQADHTLLDIWVQGDNGKLARPWLSIILDDYSRAIAGYRLSFQAPSALQTALTLCQAIWRKDDPGWHVCGIPSTFYTDHGSDFTSQHLEQVAADVKMVLIFCNCPGPLGTCQGS